VLVLLGLGSVSCRGAGISRNRVLEGFFCVFCFPMSDSGSSIGTNFHSAEGYYSQLVFKKKVLVKIIGRGYDDFSKDPVILSPSGALIRSEKQDIANKLAADAASHNSPEMRGSVLSVRDLSPIVVSNLLVG
jgi:hypothetical protein